MHVVSDSAMENLKKDILEKKGRIGVIETVLSSLGRKVLMFVLSIVQALVI